MAKKKDCGRTASGEPITDDLVEKLAAKADAVSKSTRFFDDAADG